MKISGHETPSIFERYDITDEADLVAAAEKIAAGKKLEEAKEANFGHHLGTLKAATRQRGEGMIPTLESIKVKN